ncbi:MAG: YybH family protein [Flavobacteriales bacterium]
MKQIILFALVLGIIACQSNVHSDSSAIQNIHAVMNNQQEAWNRGDIEGFMAGYWKSDSLRFIGKRGITYGWQPTLDNYKKSYPGSEAMGRLQFTNLTTELVGENSAYVIGKWELFRATDTLGGHYSLLWSKMQGQWVIVADHSS